MRISFHIIAVHYPPTLGGVSDFTRILAEGLADRGHQVHVWTTPDGVRPQHPGVTVHPSLGDLNPNELAITTRQLLAFSAPRRVLVQWSPYGFGYKGMNVPFGWWVSRLGRACELDLMVHEAYVHFSRVKYLPVALAQRMMATFAVRNAKRVWCTIPRWEDRLRPYSGRRPEFRRLPVFSNVPVQPKADEPNQYEFEFGHFSSFGVQTSAPLQAVIPKLLTSRPNARLLLIGSGGTAFRERLVAVNSHLVDRIEATGSVPLDRIPGLLGQCKLMLQCVSGGLSGRNTAALACMANGRPVVSTSGQFTEPFWATSGAVALAADGDWVGFIDICTRLSDDRQARNELAISGPRLYAERFHPRHLLDAVVSE